MKTTNVILNKRFCNGIKYTFLSIVFSSIFISCGPSKDNYDAAGTFETTEVIVSSEGTGKILSFSIQEGQLLKANEVVGSIDSLQLYLRKKQMMTGMNSMQARRPDVSKQIAAIEQQIVTAKSERKRVENLLKANAANQKQLDDINAQIAVLDKQLDAQKTSLVTTNQGITDDKEGIKFQIAQIEDQLNKCRIVSPINGTVLIKYAEMGEVASPGKALFKIADTENMILRAYVTSDQLSGLKTGQKVRVFADSGKKDMKEYSGTISWISNNAEFTPKTIQTRNERANLVYAVKINVKNDGYLKIGMYGNVLFSGK